MRRTIIGILAALALMAPADFAVAGPKSPNLPKCSGKNRRPANPHGTILPSVDPNAGTSTQAGQVQGQPNSAERERNGVEVFPGRAAPSPQPAAPNAAPERRVPPIGNASPPSRFRSC